MTETKAEPRWRRWADEKPEDGEVYMVYDGGGGSVRSWLHGSASTPTWGDDDEWMPLSEWRQVLDGIAKPEDPDEWVVIGENGSGDPTRPAWDVMPRCCIGDMPTIRCTTETIAVKVAEALNRMEGR